MLTVREALTRATGQLSAHPDLRPTALPDATLLLLHTLALDRPALLAHPERPVDREQQTRYQRLLERRLSFEPIQYILGRQEFFGLTLQVTPAVLIPRPETELLVEAVLAHFSHPSVPHSSRLHRDEWVDHHNVRILDVGTGSGAIAIALAHTLPHSSLTAIDLFPEALKIAYESAATHNLQDRIRFLQSDLLAAVADDPPYDAIVSNPPYVPTPDAPTLHPQVRDHEPPHALLKPGALLALEIGHGQRDPIAALLKTWQHITFLDDLQGIPRVVLARRSPAAL